MENALINLSTELAGIVPAHCQHSSQQCFQKKEGGNWSRVYHSIAQGRESGSTRRS